MSLNRIQKIIEKYYLSFDRMENSTRISGKKHLSFIFLDLINFSSPEKKPLFANPPAFIHHLLIDDW